MPDFTSLAKFDYNTVKSAVGSYERYEYYKQTPEGRDFLQHLAKYSIPSLLTSKIKSTFFGNDQIKNTKRTDFLKLVGDLLRPNQGFQVIITKTDSFGDAIENDFGKLVKQITLPNQIRNTTPFSRCGKDYVLATNTKWDNKFTVGFYTDANRIYSNAVRTLFQDIKDYSYFKSDSDLSDTISLEYRREIDWISSTPDLSPSLLTTLTNSLIRTGVGAVKDTFTSELNFINQFSFKEKEIHGDSTDNMRGLFGTASTIQKKLIFVIKFNDIILENIHGGTYDDERIDNYRIEDISFTFNNVESTFMLTDKEDPLAINGYTKTSSNEKIPFKNK